MVIEIKYCIRNENWISENFAATKDNRFGSQYVYNFVWILRFKKKYEEEKKRSSYILVWPVASEKWKLIIWKYSKWNTYGFLHFNQIIVTQPRSHNVELTSYSEVGHGIDMTMSDHVHDQ